MIFQLIIAGSTSTPEKKKKKKKKKIKFFYPGKLTKYNFVWNFFNPFFLNIF